MKTTHCLVNEKHGTLFTIRSFLSVFAIQLKFSIKTINETVFGLFSKALNDMYETNAAVCFTKLRRIGQRLTIQNITRKTAFQKQKHNNSKKSNKIRFEFEHLI